MTHFLTFERTYHLTIAVACAFALFAVLLLMAWITEMVFPAKPASTAAGDQPEAPDEVPERRLLVQFSCVGASTGFAWYVIRSVFAHHPLTGCYALQVVLGPIIGSAVFGTIGWLILRRLLCCRGIGVFLMYLSSTMLVGPFYVRVVMIALGLPTMAL